MKKYIPYIIAFVVGIGLGMLICPRDHIKDAEIITQSDTIYRWDTIVKTAPVEIKKIKSTDTIFIATLDTVKVRDTVYVAVPRETREYKDKDYLARVSGYDPSLDYIEVYPKTAIVTETKTIVAKKDRHNIGVGIEAGYMHSLTTPAYLEYRYIPKQWMEVYGRAEYDLPSQTPGARVGMRLGIGW